MKKREENDQLFMLEGAKSIRLVLSFLMGWVCRPPHYSPPRIHSISSEYILSFGRYQKDGEESSIQLLGLLSLMQHNIVVFAKARKGCVII